MNKTKTIPIILIASLVLLLTGCDVDLSKIDLSDLSDEDLERISDKAVVCNKPYIRVGIECELDVNDNQIADVDEITTEEIESNVLDVLQSQMVIEPEEDVVEQPVNLLSDYPDFFINGNSLNALLIIGDKAPAEDVIGISDISVSLQFANQPYNDVVVIVGAIKLVSEVANIADVNAILVGTPESNEYIASFITDVDTAMIKLFEHNGNIYVVVTGSTPSEVREASKVLANYRDYSFEGSEYVVE